MQKAVNSVALEVSSYSYIFDKLDLIPPKQKEGVLDGIDNDIDKGKKLISSIEDLGLDDVSGFVNKLFEDPEGTVAKGKNIGTTFGSFIEALKATEWEKELDELGNVVLGETTKALINLGLSEFYTQRIEAGVYLPQDYENFCKLYNIEDDKKDRAIKFSVNFLPDKNNNTVFVKISCKIGSPIKFAGIEKKTIVKVAYCPLWVK